MPGILAQVFVAQALHELHRLFHQPGVGLGQGGLDDGDLARQRRVVEVVVQAAAAQRVRQFARAVAGEDDARDVAWLVSVPISGTVIW